jgi:uncharacterized protein (DUF1330 family)
MVPSDDQRNVNVTAYLIARVEVLDPDAYKLYTARSPGAVAAHGGRFIVRAGPVETLEGPEESRRLVVIEFPNREAATKFYHAADYQEIVGLRHAAATSELILVDGADADVPPREDRL